MNQSIKVIIKNGVVHLSFYDQIITFSENACIGYEDKSLTISEAGKDRIEKQCSPGEFQKIYRKYLRALKPDHKPHLIWATAVVICVVWSAAVIPFHGAPVSVPPQPYSVESHNRDSIHEAAHPAQTRAAASNFPYGNQ